MNVPLTPELEQFVHEKVKSGRYLSISEVICEGLRLLQERDHLYQVRLEHLQEELAIGVAEADRGELLDGEEVIHELYEELRRNSQSQ